MNLLSIKNLNVSFADVHAVKDLSFDVAEGSFTALLGESGSGKSVTALSISRLLPAAVGEILWNRNGVLMDLMQCSDNQLNEIRGREISYVFQDPASSLNPVLRCGAQVTEAYLAHYPSEPYGLRRRALDLFDALRIPDPSRAYDCFPHELSGGMRQRVMIAMALIAEPRLLIADEPTTALDVSVEDEILKNLRDIQQQRKFTILFITHDVKIALKYADKAHVLCRGELVESLSRGLLGLSSPRQTYTKRLFNADLLHVKPKSFIEV